MNPIDLLKNIQNFQGELAKIQEKLKNICVTGSSGGNIVKVSVNGTFEVTAVEIDPIAVDPRDVPMLQDLIKAAIHDARTRLQEAIKNELGPLLGGLAGQGTDISGLINLLGVQ